MEYVAKFMSITVRGVFLEISNCLEDGVWRVEKREDHIFKGWMLAPYGIHPKGSFRVSIVISREVD